MGINTEIFSFHNENNEINKSIKNWKSKHDLITDKLRKYLQITSWTFNEAPWPLRLTEKNMDSIFISIYSFREIILRIDFEIEKTLKNKHPYKKIDGDKVTITKYTYFKLIDQWDRCEHTDYKLTEIDKLGIKLIDIYRIKYINYMSLIFRLLSNYSIIYTYELNVETY